VEADETTIVLPGRQLFFYRKGWKIPSSDPEAHYHSVRQYDLSEMEPQVAVPIRRPTFAALAILGWSRRSGRPLFLHEWQAGGSSGGGAVAHEGERCPSSKAPGDTATRQVYLDSLRLGLLEILRRGGRRGVSAHLRAVPGGHMGILAKPSAASHD